MLWDKISHKLWKLQIPKYRHEIISPANVDGAWFKKQSSGKEYFLFIYQSPPILFFQQESCPPKKKNCPSPAESWSPVKFQFTDLPARRNSAISEFKLNITCSKSTCVCFHSMFLVISFDNIFINLYLFSTDLPRPKLRPLNLACSVLLSP